jgi:RNA polymerase sigma-70 factor (ECF subfamily)
MALRHRGKIERNKKEILRDLECELMEIGPDMHHLPGNNGSDETGRLLSAMEQLGESQRKCIELFYLEEISYKEVSIMTGLSMNEVKSHIQNGKRNLRIILEKDRK